jgi:hypothetical protein
MENNKSKKSILILVLPLIMITLIGCKKEIDLTESKSNLKTMNSDTISSSDENKYIEYLKEFENRNDEIMLKKIENETFWVTSNIEAGTKQEFYWKNINNKLEPKFIFEYGGINWDEPLEYTFISIEKRDTISGDDIEKNIEFKKEEFIKSQRK